MNYSTQFRQYSQSDTQGGALLRIATLYAAAGVAFAVVILSGVMAPVMNVTGEYPILLNTGGFGEALYHGLVAPLFFVPFALIPLRLRREAFQVRGHDLGPVAAWTLAFVGSISVLLTALLVGGELNFSSAWLLIPGVHFEFLIEFGIPAAVAVTAMSLVDSYWLR